MHAPIHAIVQTRTFLLNMLNDLSPVAVNKVPVGFNNNIIWNIGHLTAALQGICYLRSGLEAAVLLNDISPFKNGTKPEIFYDQPAINSIKQVFLSSVLQLNDDYDRGIFTSYTSWIPRYGVSINNIDEAISFLFYHEGIHTGYIMALKKLV
jgi:hypothetical protein